MAISWRISLFGVVIAIIAAAYAYWSANLVNTLHFHPVDLKGKTALVTGATEGIGKETAIVLASWGANLILPVRGSKKSEALKADILKEAAKGVKIEMYNDIDFADFHTVREFAKKIEGETIDILINNAGMMTTVVEATKDGNDVMYQVNHLSPFLLTYLLIPALKKSPSARVVFVSSSLHEAGSVGTFKYSTARRGLQEDTFSARYKDTKLMNVMSAITFSEHFGINSKITFNSLNPGFVVSNLDNSMPPAIAAIASVVRQYVGRPTRQGAMTQVTVGTHPALDGVTARYFSDGCMNELCNTTCYYCDKKNPPGLLMNEEAYNQSSRDWLWHVSKTLTSL